MFLIKIDAATGVTQWGSKYGVATNDWQVDATDVAADPVTGTVLISGEYHPCCDACGKKN